MCKKVQTTFFEIYINDLYSTWFLAIYTKTSYEKYDLQDKNMKSTIFKMKISFGNAEQSRNFSHSFSSCSSYRMNV